MISYTWFYHLFCGRKPAFFFLVAFAHIFTKIIFMVDKIFKFQYYKCSFLQLDNLNMPG